MYTYNDSKGKTLCLFYLMAVVFKSYFWEKTVDTTAGSSNFDYLKVIYLKGTHRSKACAHNFYRCRTTVSYYLVRLRNLNKALKSNTDSEVNLAHAS